MYIIIITVHTDGLLQKSLLHNLVVLVVVVVGWLVYKIYIYIYDVYTVAQFFTLAK